MFYLLRDSWIKLLENKSNIIRDELNNYIIKEGKENLSGYYAYSSSVGGWLTIPLLFFKIKNENTLKHFPNTYAILQEIPELITAEFSIIEPNTHIKEHEGYSKQVMRTHLGLKIPHGDLALKCNNEIKKWEEGKTISFNDGYLHEAWNNSAEDRWVLMIDTPIPNSEYSSYDISKYKLENLKDPVLLNIAPKEKWMEWFYNSNS